MTFHPFDQKFCTVTLFAIQQITSVANFYHENYMILKETWEKYHQYKKVPTYFSNHTFLH